MFNTAAAVGKSMHQPGAAIIVPERAWVNPSLGGFYTVWRRPFAQRIAGVAHKDPLIRGTEKHPETAGMKTDARGPNTFTRRETLVRRQCEPLEYMINDSPVNQIRRMQ